MTSMASDLAAILSSPILRIYAAEETTFIVHEHVLTTQSEPFRRALTGEWTESTDRAIDLQEWELATVVRMMEFLYRGAYKCPDPTEVVPPVVSTRVRARNSAIPVHTYGEALLAHAKVYHLAHYKAIDPLRALALQNMDQTLGKVDLVNGHVALVPIVEFVRYVYANTDHLDNHKEPLRTLVSNFVARNFQAIRSAPSITQLLSEGGDIVMDVIMAVSTGLSLSQPSAPSVPRYPPRYIKKVELVSSSHQSVIPHDHVRDLTGISADLNCGTGDGHKFKWLYPIHTTDAAEACDKFKFVVGSYPGYGMSIEGNRHLTTHHNYDAKAKITAVALLRQDEEVLDVSCIQLKYGTFDGMTGDFNHGRPGGYLYLVWKSAKV